MLIFKSLVEKKKEFDFFVTNYVVFVEILRNLASPRGVKEWYQIDNFRS